MRLSHRWLFLATALLLAVTLADVASGVTSTPGLRGPVHISLVSIAAGIYLDKPMVDRSALEHPTRLRIYNHLLVLPGDHFRSIVRALNLGGGSGRHHLNVLVKKGLVREDKSNGRCRYYVICEASKADRNELFEGYWNCRDVRAMVLNTTRDLGEATPTRVAKMLGISRQLANYHLQRLSETGVVQHEGEMYRSVRVEYVNGSGTEPSARPISGLIR